VHFCYDCVECGKQSHRFFLFLVVFLGFLPLAGVLVHKGKTLHSAAGGGAVFGKTADGHWVLGAYDPATSKLDVPEAMSGFGWLVQNGTAVPAAGGEVAPRTTIGVDADGHLVIMEVDGCEKCNTGDQGQTLLGMAELLIKQGVVHAINLDGGGSSSVISNGTFINRPTCVDTWVPICERAVTTVVCVV
jgi:N-acetylglucosamine-1-phosphodiester alpha-N-acetylglucosaminidase